MGNEYVVNKECPHVSWRTERLDEMGEFAASATAMCKASGRECPVLKGEDCVLANEMAEQGLSVQLVLMRDMVPLSNDPPMQGKQASGRKESLNHHEDENEMIILLLQVLATHWNSMLTPYLVEDSSRSASNPTIA